MMVVPHVCRSAAAVAEAAAAAVVQAAARAVAVRGRFLLALSGGRTPVALYRLLTDAVTTPLVAWERTHVFFVDERCVPPTDARSNYRLVQETGLLQRPLAAVYRIEGERPAPEAAADYDKMVRRAAAGYADECAEVPQLDVVVLGMGGDGHTASLFPGSEAVGETRRVAVAASSPDGLERVTLTLPVLWRAREILFLVTGAEKAGIVRQVLSAAQAGREGQKSPAALAMAGTRAVTLLLDGGAASLLGEDASDAVRVCGPQ